MAAAFYETQLLVLIAYCVCAVLTEKRVASKAKQGSSTGSSQTNGHIADDEETDSVESGRGSPARGAGWRMDHNAAASKLTRDYLLVYALVMGADWLQGPYVYSLYREQYGFPERIVATLFVTGFLSAGVTAPLVGAWADQHGRKRVCMLFCLTYAGACACTLTPALPILFFGRVLGGISTSILYSGFESWLVSSSNNAGLSQGDLSKIFGSATLVNGFVATASGVMSNEIVGLSSTYTSPFIASGLILLISWVVIRSVWTENYGGGGGVASTSDPFQLRRLGVAWRIVSQDLTLLSLGLTQTCFEGSMYLFVFAWVPSLQEVSPKDEPLPLGYIFSSFMISMMLGSLLYTCIVSYLPPGSRQSQADSPLVLHAKLSSLVCTVSALSLAISVCTMDPRKRFWAFCMFEACVGMYYPVQGMLRGTLISNDHRATLSSLFRVPLNIFVVFALMNGISSARLLVFSGCAFVLGISAIMTALVVVKRAEALQAHA